MSLFPDGVIESRRAGPTPTLCINCLFSASPGSLAVQMGSAEQNELEAIGEAIEAVRRV